MTTSNQHIKFLATVIASRTIQAWGEKNYPEFKTLNNTSRAAVKLGKMVVRGLEQSARLWRIGLNRNYKPLMSWQELMDAADFSDEAAEIARSFVEDHLVVAEHKDRYPEGGRRDLLVQMYLEKGVCPSLAYQLESAPFFQAWALGRHKNPYCVPSALLKYKTTAEKFLTELDCKEMISSVFEDLMQVEKLIGEVTTDARSRIIGQHVMNGWTREEASETVAMHSDAEVLSFMEEHMRYEG